MQNNKSNLLLADLYYPHIHPHSYEHNFPRENEPAGYVYSSIGP